MSIRGAFVATSAVVAVGLAPVAAYAAPATCDAYSGTCVKGGKIVKPPTTPGTSVAGESTTLPFTGAEIVLMTLVGGGALGAGATLVVAGRRRRTQVA